MTGSDTHQHDPHVPFICEMVISFFLAARATLDPVLQAIDGYRELQTDPSGRPAAPDHVARKFSELPAGMVVSYVGACLCATTSLGIAYVHSFRLLSLLSQHKDPLPANAAKPHLAKLFDALPIATQNALSKVYHQVGAHDFELELGIGPFPKENRNDEVSGGRDFPLHACLLAVARDDAG